MYEAKTRARRWMRRIAAWMLSRVGFKAVASGSPQRHTNAKQQTPPSQPIAVLAQVVQVWALALICCTSSLALLVAPSAASAGTLGAQIAYYWGVSARWNDSYTNPKTWFTGQAACDGYMAGSAGAWWGWYAIYQDDGSGDHGSCQMYNTSGVYQGGTYAGKDGTAPQCPAHASLDANQTTCSCENTYDADSGECWKLRELFRAKAPQSCPTCKGDPIYPLLGSQRETVRMGVSLRGMELLLSYDSSYGLQPSFLNNITMLVEPKVLGSNQWKSNFHPVLKVAGDPTGQIPGDPARALLARGDGSVLTFTGDGSGNYVPDGYNTGSFARLTNGYRYTDSGGRIDTFNASRQLVTSSTSSGGTLTYAYIGDKLASVTADDARTVKFSYSGQRIATITGPDTQTISLAYDSNGNLVSLTWPDGKVRQFTYEIASVPWYLTGVIDENGDRYATFAADITGHAISTENALGTNKYAVGYSSAPSWIVTDTRDTANKVIFRTHSWQPPTGVSVTDPRGQLSSLVAEDVLGIPSVSSESYPAGSGSVAAEEQTAYDAAGNVASKVDTAGAKTCYSHDARHREVVRVEGLASTVVCSSVLPGDSTLPTGVRKIATAWHPDWKMPVTVTEPLRKDTSVYQGQPDPFNANATINCTPAPTRADGKPVPVLCKRVEQALLANGTVDATVAARSESFTYDTAGRVINSVDAKGGTTTYAYFTATAFVPGGSVPYDPYYDQVMVLLHADGTNGATSIVDSSRFGRTAQRAGTARITTSHGKFGGASLALDGSGNYLWYGDSADFGFGTGDFTLEGFVLSSGSNLLFDPRATVYDSNGAFVTNNSGTGNGIGYYSFETGMVGSGPATNDGNWHHYAWTRASGTFRMFVDGVKVYETAVAGSFGASRPFYIGSNFLNGGSFTGFIDEVRITKGVARYTGSFTVPSAAFPGPIVPSPSDIGHTAGARTDGQPEGHHGDAHREPCAGRRRAERHSLGHHRQRLQRKRRGRLQRQQHDARNRHGGRRPRHAGDQRLGPRHPLAECCLCRRRQ
jgi:YD repeat-containing protein